MNYDRQMRSEQQKNHRPILEIWRRLQEEQKRADDNHSPISSQGK